MRTEKKLRTCLEILARQTPLDNNDWIEMLEARVRRLKPYLRALTLKSLNNFRIIYDDYGLHALSRYDNSKLVTIDCDIDFRGIFPEERMESTCNKWLQGTITSERPHHLVGVNQTFWTLTRDGNWATVTISSDISYIEESSRPCRKCTPKVVAYFQSELNDYFFESVGCTPQGLFKQLGTAAEELVTKRLKTMDDLHELRASIRTEDFFFLNFPPPLE